MKVLIGGIAEKLNLYTAEPANMTKTVKFDLVRSTDNTRLTANIVIGDIFAGGGEFRKLHYRQLE